VTDPAPRLPPLPTERWGDAGIAALRGAFPSRVVDSFLSAGADARPVPNALATMLHHPALSGPWLAYNQVLLADPALGHRARELMVLRVAWRTRARYEWVQHVELASRFGIAREDIEAVAAGVDAPSWTPLERDLVAAVDQLIDGYRIDDDTWVRLAGQLDERQLIEVAFVVGTYTCLAMLFNSAGIQVEPGIDLSHIPAMPD
jgi:4-carboxymuconolactone decarboxylase